MSRYAQFENLRVDGPDLNTASEPAHLADIWRGFDRDSSPVLEFYGFRGPEMADGLASYREPAFSQVPDA